MSTTQKPPTESLRDVLLAKAKGQGANDRSSQRVLNRLAFQTHLEEIKEALGGSANKHFVWSAMTERGLLDVTYRTFLKWCTEAGIPKKREAPKSSTAQPQTAPAQPSEPPKFKHNSNPSREALFAKPQKKKQQ